MNGKATRRSSSERRRVGPPFWLDFQWRVGPPFWLDYQWRVGFGEFRFDTPQLAAGSFIIIEILFTVVEIYGNLSCVSTEIRKAPGDIDCHDEGIVTRLSFPDAAVDDMTAWLSPSLAMQTLTKTINAYDLVWPPGSIYQMLSPHIDSL